MEATELVVKIREEVGSNTSRRINKNKQIPCVVYGANTNFNITVERSVFNKLISAHESDHIILPLKVLDKNDATLLAKKIIIKHVQRNAISEEIIHIDFQVIDMNKKLRTTVPVVITGKPEGIKTGGILEQLFHEVKIECLPAVIPEHISIDVTPLKMGEAFHVSDIKPVEGIKILTDEDTVLAVVAIPAKEEVKADAATAAATPTTATPAEPELIAKKKKEEVVDEKPAGKAAGAAKGK